MKLLIVVCAYNEEKNIKRCLDSIEISMQSHGSSDNIEVLVVDNSSKDKTAEIAKPFCETNDYASYVKIEHCFLCVSRNSYKNVESNDYVAYVDSDGYLESSYISTLCEIIKSLQPDVLSGPVLEANGSNKVWECFYDSKLWTGKYLIGANMVFKRSLLDQVDGFPNLFRSRGDESGLLLKLKERNIPYEHVFDERLITYNIFCDDIKSILKTQYSDGFRSYLISRISANSIYHWINLTNRVISTCCLLLAIVFLFFYPLIGLSLISLSYASYGLRFRRYHFKLATKVMKQQSLQLAITAIVVFLSKYVFDLGYVLQSMMPFDQNNFDLDSFENPLVLESSHVPR